MYTVRKINTNTGIGRNHIVTNTEFPQNVLFQGDEKSCNDFCTVMNGAKRQSRGYILSQEIPAEAMQGDVVGIDPTTAEEPIDLRLAALMMHLDDPWRSHYRELNYHVYRHTSMPDGSGEPPLQKDWMVLTMNEAQKHWHTSDGCTVVDASQATIGGWYVFEA